MLVRTDEQMRIWNELMINEHPQGVGPLVGRQLRYLISSAYGWLGGFGFASAALQLTDRDQWIGWDAEQRQKHLHLVINMSRFLIRPNIHCKNLASKVLSMSLLRLQDDFKQKYGYKPLLVESFVDDSFYSGTCYQAANWIEIGKTKGRGRQDRFNRSPLTVKSIYVYSFKHDFRTQMGLSLNAGQG
ncbi:MAG: Druantia anti-phage system protein DruA, partial [Waddliaceae bacterium]